MITELEEQLSSVCNGRKRHEGMVDVTLPLQVISSNKDRNIVKARLRYNGPGRDAFIVMVVGLRSDILSGFDRFEQGKPDRFMPCDLLGVVKNRCCGPSLRASQCPESSQPFAQQEKRVGLE